MIKKMKVTMVDNGFIVEDASDSVPLPHQKSVVIGFDYEALAKELKRRFESGEKK